MVVIFDVVGTLFSTDRVEKVFNDSLGRPELFNTWFARLLQIAMAATLAGRYVPFRDAGEASLRQVLAAAGYSDEIVPAVLEAMQELTPWEDAADCLSALQSRDHRLVALTNSSRDAAEKLLGKAGLRAYIAEVISTDEAGACKPHAKPYELALVRTNVPAWEACMVAAHGWDVVGAQAAGLQAVWVSRLEHRWPFPGTDPETAVEALADVPGVIARMSGRT